MTVDIILSGDIGGTNTRLALYEVVTPDNFVQLELHKVDELPGKITFHKQYKNDGYASLQEVIRLFLQEAKCAQTPATACFAVAGPVSNNRAILTNRGSWDIDGEKLEAALGIKRISVVNDFVAMGYGILSLNEEKECVTLQHAEKNHSGPIACIGPGTGLGECYITPYGPGAHRCYASEGGHAEFAPRDELEIRLLQYLRVKFQSKHRISVERIVSGIGLYNVYEFLATQERPTDVNPAVHAQVMAAPESERGRVIGTSVDACQLCAQAMRIFTAAYGAEAGVAALKWLPTGGLYLTGGLTPKNLDHITGTRPGTEGVFMGALLDKGRVSGALKSIPVYAVLVEDLGERGALFTALRLLQEVKAGPIAAAMVATLEGSVGSSGTLTTPAAATATATATGGCCPYTAASSCQSGKCPATCCLLWGTALLAAGIVIGFYGLRHKHA